MALIEIRGLTKDYGYQRGNFDVTLTIERGEFFGFVGTNGAGKTTLIRHLMGFLKADHGHARIDGLDCWADSAEIKRQVGYIPGEIAFPDAPTGSDFLKRQAELLKLTDMSYADALIEKLQLDPSANLKRMSKGMKQKTAIVAALMADSPILIMDEPTTGLDPLMRAEFVDLLNDERSKGKTIFMSSHMFDEVEDTCDTVAMIKEGSIIDVKSTLDIKHNENKVYKLEFASHDEYERFGAEPFTFEEKREDQNQVFVQVNDADIRPFLTALKGYQLKFMTEIKYTLEQYFKSLYERK